LRLTWKNYIFETDPVNVDSIYAVCFLGEYDYLLRSIRDTDIVLDAGANIGAFSIVASKRAKKIYALEPHPTTFELFTKNIRLNKCTNIIPLNLALSDKVGYGRLNGLGESAHLADSGLLVRTATLGSITHEVTAVKMDIEGEELAVLSDRASLSNVRVIAVETHGNFFQIATVLHESGFYLTKFKPSNAYMFRKAINLDFLVDELRTHFTVSKRAVRFLLRMPEPLVVPQWILYGDRIPSAATGRGMSSNHGKHKS
jgi:FkbM family methyltransferase